MAHDYLLGADRRQKLTDANGEALLDQGVVDAVGVASPLYEPAALRTVRCREMEGALIVKWLTISPALSSPARRSWRICRRVGSARARNTPDSSAMTRY